MPVVGIKVSGIGETIDDLKNWNLDGGDDLRKAIEAVAIEGASVVLRQIEKDLAEPEGSGLLIELKPNPTIVTWLIGETLMLEVDVLETFRKDLQPGGTAYYEAAEWRTAGDAFRELAGLCDAAAERDLANREGQD